jgi:hypothetical protein
LKFENVRQKRIYLSDYAKRKLKKEAEDAVSKLPKLTNFFKTANSVNEVEVEANTNNKDDFVLNNSYLDGFFRSNLEV